MSALATSAGRSPQQRWDSGRSLAVGVLGSLALALLYALIVGGISRSMSHLISQVGQDWYLIAPLMVGFGVQIGLVAELRRRHRLMRTEAAAGATGAGASTLGMVACCAHHVADLAPLIGLSGAATFLVQYRLPFVLVGLGTTAGGIFISARRLRSVIQVSRP